MDLPAPPPPRPDLPEKNASNQSGGSFEEIIAGVIHEPSADERIGDRVIETRTPEELEMSPSEIYTGFLLAAAVFRLGGSMVLTEEECHQHYALMLDEQFHRETNGVRLWSVQHEAKH